MTVKWRLIQFAPKNEPFIGAREIHVENKDPAFAVTKQMVISRIDRFIEENS